MGVFFSTRGFTPNPRCHAHWYSLIISNTSAKSTLRQEDKLSWQRFRKVSVNHQPSTQFLSPFICGKLPVGLDHPSTYHKWRCENHIVEEATDFSVCDLVIFRRKKNRRKIDVNFRHNFEFVRQLIFQFWLWILLMIPLVKSLRINTIYIGYLNSIRHHTKERYIAGSSTCSTK
jgi:hypothetical protein